MSKAPIWAVAAPGSRKPRFTREQIADAALHIADSEGFEALSMRRVAEELGAGTMTLYYYVRTKEDLLALVEDALMGEIVAACEPVPKAWRPAVTKIATATRGTYVRHTWALRSLTGIRVGPNNLRHIEQSLQALAHVELDLGVKLQTLSIIDDYVFGHCLRVSESHDQPHFDRKTANTMNELMTRYLADGEYPQIRAMIGDDEPIDAFIKHSEWMTEGYFEIGLDALLDGLAKRLKLK
jgi:AcrR family transcriptional regulator